MHFVIRERVYRMLVIKKIKDLMVDIDEYPRIPSEISIKQAIKILKSVMVEGRYCFYPMIALVFNDNRLVGTLRLRDILKGLEPDYLKASTKMQGYSKDNPELSVIWDSLFDRDAKELAERPVSDVMNPIKAFVAPDDPIVKAAYLMIHNDLLVLPVLEGKKKVVGLIRMIEVFDALSGSVLDEETRSNIIELRKLI